MAVRIYSLAKELKLDSKVLVDICTSAGVTGKGSALASLTDEEVERVRAFMAGGMKAPAAPKRAAPSPTVAAPAAPTPTEPTVVRREDYMAPGAAKEIPVLDLSAKNKKKTANGEPAPKPAPRPLTPSIKLAAMPSVQQPDAKPVSNEPAPQKPDIRLSADQLRSSRSGAAGSKPLQEHLRKHELSKRTQDATPAAKGEQPMGLPGRDRATRRGTAAEAPPAGAPLREKPKRGRGPVAAEGEALLGDREQRQLNRKRVSSEPRRRGPEDEEAPAGAAVTAAPFRRRSLQRQRRSGANTAAPRKGNVTLELPCTVRSFSEAVGVPAAHVLKQLMAMGTMATMNHVLEPETAEMLAVEMGVEVDFKKPLGLADRKLTEIDELVDDPATLVPRPPVITVLGHVDHGKTTLLDRIIGINVASGESGGITQHIRAYEIEKDGRKIAFVDTPGHEAFTEMRARGANVTDIAVLVVAADDGVMPQTEEAISHARAAGVPIVVAMNKIDLPGVDPQRVLQQLAASELLPTEWGGDTEVIKTSAITGEGIDALLETLLTIAELHDYRANPDRPAVGTCLEAELHEGRGVVVKAIVQDGTLRVGDAIVCGTAFGRVKAMYDTLKPHVTYREATPSTPVNLTGLNVAPERRRAVLRARRRGHGPADRHRARRAKPAGYPGTRRGRPRHAGKPVRSARPRRSPDAEPDPAGRHSRLDRGDPERVFQARASGSQAQAAAGDGGRHYRGRRAPGECLGRDHHRLQRRPGRRGPLAGRPRRGPGPAVRHHLQADRRSPRRARRHAQARGTRGRTRPGPGAAARLSSAAWARSPAAGCWPATCSATAGCA